MNYFAYGTLLDVEGMQKYAPSAKPLGIMKLMGYRMGFGACGRDGVTGCTLDVAPDEVMYGIQYELSKEDMDKLDDAAVADDMWARKDVTLIDEGGNEVQSVTYEIPGLTRIIAPSDDYVRPILKGLDELDLPKSYVLNMTRLIAQAQSA
ncbi:gamma-glutamylcyclotransferase family protein [Ruegeria sp. EL01]|jgi:hypothetical protein|uniref:gamma-glutamylcyclotransferase family protein n=1 Tax=Ruegeria sp. EL01 TaxID=2107578 RepID=UPI000EA82125|nr:gamma-glutamylcyclotransferase family protein [Ruegeria sp. EL01]